MSTYFVGTEVEARGLRWEIVDVRAMGDQTLLRLRGLEGIFARGEVDILTPFERVRPIIHEFQFGRPTQLANWRTYQQAFLLQQALGPNAFASAHPGRLLIEPYQLVPVARALRMIRPRLLLADDVGLGKTAEAGLVIAELIARRRAARVLIVSPAGPLLAQWKSEMLERFGLLFTQVDRFTLDTMRRTTELGANPLDFIPLALASMDFLKQEKLLDLLERALPYDIVVMDEAHHFAESGSSDPDEAERSQRRRLGEVLARRSDSLFLLSATPHDGYERSFASLLELLDQCLVDRRGLLRGQQYRLHVVRRLKQHVRFTNPTTGQQEAFKERRVLPIEVDTSDPRYAPFVAMHQQLLASVGPELKRALASRNYDDALTYLTLLKRSTSTVEALAITLERIEARLSRLAQEQRERAEAKTQRLKTLRSLEKKLARFGALSAEEVAEREELEIEDLARKISEVALDSRTSKLAAQHSRFAADTLAELRQVVEAARLSDPKLGAVVTQIQSIRATEPQANVLIYTEYKDSQRILVETLRSAGFGEPLTLSGEDSDRERHVINEMFRTQHNQVLVATDAAAEGLNLQHHCHHLIHLELPWNPNRTEQRNGRVDRYGQTEIPEIRLLFLCGTFEERILARLIAKYEQQRRHLHFVPNTLGLGADEVPFEGLFALLTDETAVAAPGRPCRRFTFEQPTEAEGDREVAALLAEIDKSLRTFERVARDNAWLSVDGAYAEEEQPQQAASAFERGQRAGVVDLVEFVCDAVRLEGGQVRQLAGDVLELALPASWLYGLDRLEGFPGWRPDVGRFQITRQLSTEKDSAGNPIGFLGRVHPLVQRAIEHVRHLEFGQESGPDRRVSAAYASEIQQPTLIVTCVARLQSRSGREWERLLAIRVDASSPPRPLLETAQWLPEIGMGAPTKNLWQRAFHGWGETAVEEAQKAASETAEPLAQEFIQQQRAMLGAERRLLDEWLVDRARALLGKEKAHVSSVVRQERLFDEDKLRSGSDDEDQRVPLGIPNGVPVPLETVGGPGTIVARLVAVAADKSRASRERSEAEVIFSAYQRRYRVIDERADLRPMELSPVGLLMLLPANWEEERQVL